MDSSLLQNSDVLHVGGDNMAGILQTKYDINLAIEQLTHPRSSQRRSAAKKLRQSRNIQAGNYLLSALAKEVQDPRTWETQYQMIMALAECGYKKSLSYLRKLASSASLEPMIYVALGDAIVRLARRSDNDPTPIMKLLATKNEWLIEGAFRAISTLHLTLNKKAVQKIIAYVSALPNDHHLRFWVAAAAAEWDKAITSRFLQECITSENSDLRKAAAASLQGKYLKWNPL
jgi:HEAT repeat protein